MEFSLTFGTGDGGSPSGGSTVVEYFLDSGGYERFKAQETTKQLSAFGTVAILQPLYRFRYVWNISNALLTLDQANAIEAGIEESDEAYRIGSGGEITLNDNISGGTYSVLIREFRKSFIKQDICTVSFVAEEL